MLTADSRVYRLRAYIHTYIHTGSDTIHSDRCVKLTCRSTFVMIVD